LEIKHNQLLRDSEAFKNEHASQSKEVQRLQQERGDLQSQYLAEKERLITIQQDAARL
jgi:hypothetical protein